MLTSRAKISVGVFSLGVHRLTCRCEHTNQLGSLGFNELVIAGCVLHTSLSHGSLLLTDWEKPVMTHQEPDAELTEEPLVVLIILFVVKFDVVQRVVGRG